MDEEIQKIADTAIRKLDSLDCSLEECLEAYQHIQSELHMRIETIQRELGQ